MCLDGLDGDVEEAGDVFVFEAVFFDQGEDEFAAWWKVVDGGAKVLQRFVAYQDGFGVGFEADIVVAAFAEFDGFKTRGIAKIV